MKLPAPHKPPLHLARAKFHVYRPLTPPYVSFGIRRFLLWMPFEIGTQQTRVTCLFQDHRVTVPLWLYFHDGRRICAKDFSFMVSTWLYDVYYASWSFNQIWFRVNAKESNVCSFFLEVSSHSHTVMQCQPMAARSCSSSISRSLFLLIFAIQKSRLALGSLQHLVLSILSILIWCPCQKHPLTKIHVRYLRNTKSGCPGNRLWFNRNLKPLFHNPRRTIISGFVSFDLTAAILLLWCDDWLSIFL